MAYLNFALDLTQQSDGRYSISVLASPVGEAGAIVENPFSADEISAILDLINAQSAGKAKFEDLQTARLFGQRLFHFLIRQNDDINAAYFASLDRAGASGLRIRLSVEKAGPLTDVPWELLCDPNRDFLALSRSTPIVRYNQQLSIRPPVPITTTLRVLVMIAAPKDFPTLDVEGEWQRLQEATAELQRKGVIQLERLDSATLIALQRRLRAEDYHVFHFIGHSDYDPTRGQGFLALEREGDNSKAQLITGAALARELGEESTIRLVVLNSCRSARRAEHGPFAGIASGLVVRGIPAVVAMQFPISDGAAKAFAEEFYRVIGESLPIDTALSEARRAIANRMQNLEWVTPVLYMRTDDGILFQTAKRATATVKPVRRRVPLPTLLALGVLAAVVVVLAFGSLAGWFGPAQEPTATPTPAGQPNLQITNIRTSPLRPAPGQVFRLLISIRNAGTVDSGPFTWTWDASPDLLNELDDEVDNIAPGATRNISFPYSYGWWGSYSSQIVIDADGNVVESNERDNRRAQVIELDPTSPFEIDFTFLPNNDIITPPRPLEDGLFARWNLRFGLDTTANPNCGATTLTIIEIENAHAVTSNADPPECASLPLAIVLDKPVGNAAVEVVPSEVGEAALRLFEDRDGATITFEGEPTPLDAGTPLLLTASDDVQRRVQRIVVEAANQPVTLSRLILFPLTE